MSLLFIGNAFVFLFLFYSLFNQYWHYIIDHHDVGGFGLAKPKLLWLNTTLPKLP